MAYLARYIQAPAALSAIGKHNLQHNGGAEWGKCTGSACRSAISATVGCGGCSKLDCFRRRMQRAGTGTAKDTGSVRACEAILRGIRMASMQHNTGMHDTATTQLPGLTAW